MLSLGADDDSDSDESTPSPSAAGGRGDRCTNLSTELPTAFSLLSQLKIPIDVTGKCRE